MVEQTRSLEDLKQLGGGAPVDMTDALPEPMIDSLGRSYATGKRKDAVARVWLKRGAFFQDKSLEFFNTKLRHQELDARPVAILLFTEAGEYARDRLSSWQQLFFRQERIKQFRLMRDRAEPAADI